MFMSQQLTLHASDFFCDQSLKLELIERNPQIPYPLHTHDFAELVIVLEGTGIHFTSGDSYQVNPGDVFFIEPGFAHGYRKPRNLRLYNILFDLSLLEHTLVDIRSMPGYHSIFHIEPKYRETHRFETKLRLSPDQMVSVTKLVEKICRELTETCREQGSRAMAFAYLIELIVTLSRCYRTNNPAKYQEITRLAQVFSYMEQNRSRQLSLPELLEHTYMSYSTLNRAFRLATGCSPIEYHLRLRIKDACRLLENSPLPITEVAYQCGFEDSNYFSRQFRKILRMSPRSYRKAYTHQW